MSSSEPSGVHFVDMASMRQMVLVQETDPRKDLHGWICYRNRDGVWMTLRRATEEDRRRVLLAQQVRVTVLLPEEKQA
jgi:hypothetical protein